MVVEPPLVDAPLELAPLLPLDPPASRALASVLDDAPSAVVGPESTLPSGAP
jgi:hypothetical protein